MYTLYDYLPSGNGYKVLLSLPPLSLSFPSFSIYILVVGTRSTEFLTKNPIGKIPTLEHSPGEFLFESNAILYFLAENTYLMSTDKLRKAQIIQWLCFEQYSHEPYIAVSRFLRMHGEMTVEKQTTLAAKKAGGEKALSVMNVHLKDRLFFVNNTYSIADIGLYAYTHVANEGGFELDRYPAIQAWLERVARQPRHCRITDRF